MSFLHRSWANKNESCTTFTFLIGICVLPSPFSCKLPCGLVVKASALRAEDPGFESRLWRDFWGLSHTSDLKIGTPVATLPGASRFGVSAWTGWPGVSILWLGEVDSLICNFCLSVAARKIVCADSSLRYNRKQPRNKQHCKLKILIARSRGKGVTLNNHRCLISTTVSPMLDLHYNLPSPLPLPPVASLFPPGTFTMF